MNVLARTQSRWLRCAPLAFRLAVAAALGGCASQPIATPARLAIIELPPAVDDAALRNVLHDPRAEVGEAALAADRGRIQSALDAAVRGVCDCVPRAGGRGAAVVQAPGPAELGQPLAAAPLAELASLAAADAYLRVRVTDFGTTPRRWRTAYVTFEVVTTLGITAALAIKRATRPLAAAYLIEESIEELSEGFAGFWLLNRLSRPVRIEADLIDARSGRVLWQGARTGLARWHWRNLRRGSAEQRDRLLATSTCQAVTALLRAVRSPPVAQ